MARSVGTTPLTIAIVDDDEAILDAVQLVLEEQYWDIRTYTTGEEFLADLDNREPKCVVLDPHLPGLSGAEVARSVAEANAHIPIIGLTAQPTSPLASEVVDAGARVMLTKPVTSEELVDYIRAAVSRSLS